MQFRKFAVLVVSVILVLGCGVAALAQGTGEGSPAQRLEVMRSRLDSMRRSLNAAIASTNAKDNGDEKTNADDPSIRLRGLEKEVSSVLSDVNDLRAKQDRAERIETRDLEKLETSVTDLNTRVQNALQATASTRNTSGVTSAAPQKKKKKGKFLGLFGGGDDNKYADLTDTVAPGRDRELFEVAAKEVRKSNYDTGRLLFNTIITTYPDSPFLPLSKLAIADSFHLEGTTSALIQAGQAYQDWITFFPTHPLTDRAMLKVAEAEIRQMGLPDREIPHAIKAEQRLKVLLQQFPNTPLKEDVKTRLREVQENLAQHTAQVGDFYWERYKQKKGGLKGAQSRYREVIDKYPDYSEMDKVLFRTANTYLEEEEPDEAAKYFQRIVREYPNSQYAQKSREQLAVIGAEVPTPDPQRVNMVVQERPGFMGSLMSEVMG